MNKLTKFLLLFFVVLSCKGTFAQFGQLPPFTVSIEPVTGANIPGIHSFAFAQSGDKWLIIGGRTNGLHGLNSNDGFPPEFKNDNAIVVDTNTWMYYTADLNQLPKNIADPMRSTNMQYVHEGNYLYMTGGFGYDSIANIYVTFPTLTAVHVDNMINAVINSQSIAPHVRQIVDTNLAVCGGEMSKLGSDYYLIFGHNFGGRYTDPPTPLFTQQYTERIKKFNLTDDGTTITLNNYSYQVDTNNFHRRDLNVGPIVKPDGSFALEAYGGVFQKTENLPFREPITITPSGATVHSSYQQVMSQYTCALLPVYDSISQNMYTTFFGGISLYDYNLPPNTVTRDSLVPFINDITTMTLNSSGTFEEAVLPTQLPGLLGSNAKFILNKNISHYANEVIRIRDLPNSKILAGYMFGGIRAQTGNFGVTVANDTIYRIYLTPNNSAIGIDENSDVQNVILFPNPSLHSTTLLFSLKNNHHIKVTLSDLTGKKIIEIADEEMQKGNQQIYINTSKLSAGVYFCKIESVNSRKIVKVLVE